MLQASSTYKFTEKEYALEFAVFAIMNFHKIAWRAISADIAKDQPTAGKESTFAKEDSIQVQDSAEEVEVRNYMKKMNYLRASHLHQDRVRRHLQKDSDRNGDLFTLPQMLWRCLLKYQPPQNILNSRI